MDIIECNLSDTFETVELFPLSDLHVGTKYTDYKLFDKFIAHILEQPNRYVICAGDNMDNATQFSAASSFDNNMTPQEQRKFLVEALKPIRDQILCMIPGNHELKTQRFTSIDVVETLAEALGIHDRYREDGAYLKLTFGRKATNNKRQVYTIYVVHGAGSAKGSGGAINRLESVSHGIEADIYVCGHYHKRVSSKDIYLKVDLRNNKIQEQERLYIVSSHWAAYFSGYAQKAMLRPSAKGSVPITLYAKEKRMEAVI